MQEIDLHFFIDSTINYFREVTNENVSTGIPYIKGKEPVVLEYTGIIGISGKRKGSIYITATSDMLRELASTLLSMEEVNEDVLKDLVGEIANTISGNAREAYGADFLISVPVIVQGVAEDIKMPDDVETYVIPISWKNYKNYLVVCLED